MLYNTLINCYMFLNKVKLMNSITMYFLEHILPTCIPTYLPTSSAN